MSTVVTVNNDAAVGNDDKSGAGVVGAVTDTPATLAGEAVPVTPAPVPGRKLRADGVSGWVDFDGQNVTIGRHGLWDALAGVRGEVHLQIDQISDVIFQSAGRLKGRGFVRFVRGDIPLAALNDKLNASYGPQDAKFTARLDECSMMFMRTQQAGVEKIVKAVEAVLGKPAQMLPAQGGDDAAEAGAMGTDAMYGGPADKAFGGAAGKNRPAGGVIDFASLAQTGETAPAAPTATGGQAAGSSQVDGLVEQLRELLEQREAGVIDEAEYAARKTRLFNQMA